MKLKSKSQLSGSVGESLFEFHMETIGYTANKLSKDFGEDYVVKCFDDIDSGFVENGASFIGNVKSSDNIKKGYYLDKFTLEHIVMSASPVVLILVDLKDRMIYYKPVDSKFLSILAGRILNHKGYKLLMSNMSSFSELSFKKDIDIFLSPKSIRKLLLQRDIHDIKKILGNEAHASFGLTSAGESNLDISFVPTLNLFPDHYKNEAKRIFLTCNVKDQRSMLIQSSIYKKLFSKADVVKLNMNLPFEPVLISSGDKSCNFQKRYIDNDVSFVHESSFAFVLLNDSKEKIFSIDTQSTYRIFADREFIEFLEILDVDSIIVSNDIQRSEIPLKEFDSFYSFQRFILFVDQITEYFDLEHKDFTLQKIFRKEWFDIFWSLFMTLTLGEDGSPEEIVVTKTEEEGGHNFHQPELNWTKRYIRVPFFIPFPTKKLFGKIVFEGFSGSLESPDTYLAMRLLKFGTMEDFIPTVETINDVSMIIHSNTGLSLKNLETVSLSLEGFVEFSDPIE